jgi:hypothetical protein
MIGSGERDNAAQGSAERRGWRANDVSPRGGWEVQTAQLLAQPESAPRITGAQGIGMPFSPGSGRASDRAVARLKGALA